MNVSISWSEISIQLVITLGHFIWQAAIVGLALALIQKGSLLFEARQSEDNVRRQSHNLRYIAACAAFFSLPVFVFITFFLVHHSRGSVLPVSSSTMPMEALISELPVESLSVQAPVTTDVPSGSLAPSRSRLRESTAFTLSAVSQYLSVAYCAGVLFMLLRIGRSQLGCIGLRRSIVPVEDADLLGVVARQASRLGLKQVPLLAHCERVEAPMVLGVLKPMILIPPALLCGLDPHQLSAILSHELAHIRRCDMLVNVLQRIVEALLFFHPTTWWISRQVSNAREYCCDDMAASDVGSLPYAGALLRVAELCVAKDPGRTAALATLSVLGNDSNELRRRLHVLIKAEQPPVGLSLFYPSCLSLCLAACVSVLWAQTGPTPDALGISQSNQDSAAHTANSDAVDNTEVDVNQETSVADGKPAEAALNESRLTVLVSLENDYSKSLTVWRALKDGEQEPKNSVNGSNGFAYYDPVIWEDQRHATRWIRERSAQVKQGDESFSFDSLKPGRYLITATTYQSGSAINDPTPHGESELVVVGPSEEKAVKVRSKSQQSGLDLLVVDAQTQTEVPGLALRLRDTNGMPIVHGHGSGNFFDRTNSEGKVRYSGLASGEYTVQVLGRHASINQFTEYLPVAERIAITVRPGQQRIEIKVEPRSLSQEEIDERFPFSIFGRVTDGDGNPAAGIPVWVAAGVGSLIGGGSTTSGPDGKYRMHFVPGAHMRVSEHSPLGVGNQAAHIYVDKPGWRVDAPDGYLFYLMSDNTPAGFEQMLKESGGKIWTKTNSEEVIFARQPREINLTIKRETRER